MHFLVSPHIKVHGTKYTRDRAQARAHTHARGCGAGSLSKMDGSVSVVMETLSWILQGRYLRGK